MARRKTEKYGGYGSCSWIVWLLPEWKIVIAASAYLEKTTVNIAEYTGMNNGVLAAIDHGAEDLVVVGDSRLAIQQSLGVIACRKESLMTQLSRHKAITARLRSVRYLHVVREYNAAADSLASEALESKMSNVILNESWKNELCKLNRISDVIDETSVDQGEVKTPDPRGPNQLSALNDSATVSVMTRRQLRPKTKQVQFTDKPPDNSKYVPRPLPTTPRADDVDPVAIQAERRSRIAKAQDEELRWSNLKLFIRGEVEKLGYKAARDALKIADKFGLPNDGVLQYVGASRREIRENQEETHLRLVVPTTMIQEVLQSCHDSLEGGHQGVVRTYQRVKQDYYWFGLYTDVEKHVKSCPDCSSSKSRTHLRGYSPGKVLAERPFQIVSMDFVIPLPKSRRGNTALLLFQCSFTGFVIAKAMSDTSAFMVVQGFEECVYRFGAPSLIRHDRDPRFMSEVFQAFAAMMQSRSRLP
ncbi:unnamed protein product [Phytophthora lilii]|uniref:Unnamed protein product n=1 Tax=Phytophthora lilii TaxID=2077276 RepID=A0A9W6X9H2_9STRA|nr:unnamed protein product [Phytophthora lilii]